MYITSEPDSKYDYILNKYTYMYEHVAQYICANKKKKYWLNSSKRRLVKK